MRRVAALLVTLGMAFPTASCGQSDRGADRPASALAPEFTHTARADWINSEPLSLAALRGKFVLIDVWTFECWNCYRSFPWLNAVHEDFAGQPFQIVGVHSPEFPRERNWQRVAQKVREFRFEHPVMIDNDSSYWRALGNRYWPAFYLVDKQGRLRYLYVGETHAGDPRAREIERQIAEPIAE